MTQYYEFAFWPGHSVAEQDVETYVTLTREVDLVNNVDKFRRFISIHNAALPGLRPYIFTQTGRWTRQTNMGIWTGGTVRAGGILSARAFSRSNQVHLDAHNSYVAAKRKSYSVTQGPDMLSTDRAVQLLRRADPGLVLGTGNYATATTSTATAPTQGQAMPNDTEFQELLNRANDLSNRLAGGEDAFDVFADLAVLKSNLEDATNRLELIRVAVTELNAALMAKI